MINLFTGLSGAPLILGVNRRRFRTALESDFEISLKEEPVLRPGERRCVKLPYVDDYRTFCVDKLTVDSALLRKFRLIAA